LQLSVVLAESEDSTSCHFRCTECSYINTDHCRRQSEWGLSYEQHGNSKKTVQTINTGSVMQTSREARGHSQRSVNYSEAKIKVDLSAC